ncbi:MAG TPA: putative peptidoglycan glycosyltransferase FtsW [Anaerolineae bacterium]|nr:putative peptidoglycan glycosyltransferase FtsW [Anaerolineae bacterium]
MFRRTKSEIVGPMDWILLCTALAIIALGLMMVYSSTSDMGYREFEDAAFFFRRQVWWMLVGLVAMFVAARMPYRYWTALSIPIMAATLLLLVVLVIFREGRLLVGNSVSPVEPAKLAMVIYIAHWLSSKSGQLSKLPYGLLPFTIMVGVIAGLVMAQPDISEAMVIVLVAGTMFFMAGADVIQFAIGVLGGGAAFAFVITRLPHAMGRLQLYLQQMRDPLQSENLQLIQGLVALGSGGIFGLGPGNGRMKYLWLPAAHTDSIFAIVGEELGLVGCLLLVGLFLLLTIRGLRIAAQAPDAFGRLLALGFTCWITFQALINTAVVTGAIPFTGITLPFVSVGGSSLTMCMLAVGIMLSISRTANVEGAASHEAGRVRRRDGGTRLSRPDRNQSPA